MSVTIAERIIEIKGKKSLKDLALMTGVPPGTIHNYIKKGREPSLSFVIQLCKSLNVNEKWLLTGEGRKHQESVQASARPTISKEHPRQAGKADLGESLYNNEGELREEFIRVPYCDVEASMGGGSFVESERITKHFVFQKRWVKVIMGLDPRHLILITVIGDSMEPTLREGDLILLDLRQNEVHDDAIYVLRIDNLLVAKRLQRTPGGTVYVRSDNPAYKEIEITKDNLSDLHVIGRAVWVGRKI